MIGMITIFSMYIAHVHLGSGRNSYQGHVHDSQEFSRVLGCPCVRCHWKCNIVDTFTHHFCANRHGWTIGTSFPYIRKSERWYSSPVQYIAFPLILVGSTSLYFALQALLPTQTFYKVTDRPALLLFMLHNSMAFTGEFKDLHFCTYICGGHLEPCGKPCYDKNNLPRAQMSYTPIAPVLQILYKNKKMAEAMQYWHVHLQEGL